MTLRCRSSSRSFSRRVRSPAAMSPSKETGWRCVVGKRRSGDAELPSLTEFVARGNNFVDFQVVTLVGCAACEVRRRHSRTARREDRGGRRLFHEPPVLPLLQ